jgi:small subunit ribosomal protein S20
MPITKSAKKALKVNKRRHAENLLMKQEIKNKLKGLRLAIADRKPELKSKISEAYSALDKAAKKRYIHKNKASRLKSRLAAAVKKAETSKESEAKKAVKKSLK